MARSRLVTVTLAILLVATACGDGDEESDSSSATSSPTSVTTVAETAQLEPADDDPVLDSITVEGELGAEPTVTVDTPLSVDETVRRVLIEGDGTAAEDATVVSFHFLALNASTGERFDASRPGEAPSVTLDSADLLPGLYRAMVGVPAGSRIVTLISPSEGFGPQGGLPDLGVGPEDSLVFVIDLESVSVPLERAEGEPVEPPPGLPTVTLGADGSPTIELPDGDPSGELIGQVLIEGGGPVVEAGQELTVHYTGVTWPGGDQFDSSWDRGEPATFGIGVGAVIAGWDETLVGQSVGSQLLLVIPPEKGYGEAGRPEAGIDGTDTLVFAVDILAAT